MARKRARAVGDLTDRMRMTPGGHRYYHTPTLAELAEEAAMSEQGMRQQVVSLLRPYHAFAVENPCLPGTPDVSCTLGWLELKWMRRWPAQDHVALRIPHFTQQQRLFLKNWERSGGCCWLLLKVARSWLLFRGSVAAFHLGHATHAQLREVALAVWDDGLDRQSLLNVLLLDTLDQRKDWLVHVLQPPT